MKVNQIKGGVLFSYLTLLVMVLVAFFMTPYMIDRIGKSEYGLYSLLGAFIGTLGVLDFGLNNTVVRYVAKYRHENDKTNEKYFLGTVFRLYFFISFLVLIVGLIFYYNLDYLLGNSLTKIELHDAHTIVKILIFNLIVLLPGNAFSAISYGYEKFIFPKAAIMIKYLIRAVLLLILLYYKTSALAIVILDTIMNISLIFANIFYVRYVLKIRWQFNYFNKTLLYEIFGYSFWIFLIAITHEFHWKMSQFLVGMKTNTETIAVMSIGIMLSGFYGALGAAISSVFLPKATGMVVNNATAKELTDEMIRLGRVILIIQLFVLGGFILFGKQFILLWLGEDYGESWEVALWIMCVMTLEFSQSFGSSILEAKKMIRFKSIFYLLSISIGLFIGYLIIDHYSMLGMVKSFTLAMLINTIVIMYYYKLKINIDVFSFIKETFFKSIFLFLIVVLFFEYVLHLFPISSWYHLIVQIIIYCFIYVVTFFFFGLRKEEKLFLWNN